MSWVRINDGFEAEICDAKISLIPENENRTTVIINLSITETDVNHKMILTSIDKPIKILVKYSPHQILRMIK